ncbi:Cytoplasmic dynein 2 light intermediate chain 1 [Clydaea vesicula]|uniref:Cytoplasmic dynein 2 light intermediate chain 1 n=1 Tax=Clydaea vesicula TaxID=447962 RepID=A0AAD5TWY7_9FUNG|nr:Cytoplasmic dynein 2 light intermediate chain 1 [Clydaea vesicula]
MNGRQNKDSSGSLESIIEDSSTNISSSFNKKDIWSLIKEKNAIKEKKPTEDREVAIESYVLFVGDKNSGKSELIVRFLDREEKKVDATVALQYTFCRRTRGVNSIKDVAHLWELAGGIFLSELINVPITEFNLQSLTYVIVLDLSEPQDILTNLENYLDKFWNRVNSIFKNLEQRGSKRPKNLKNLSWKKFGSEHPDKDYLTPSPLPIIIVGNKFDVFRNFEPYVAHKNGASLIYTAHRDENSIMKFRNLLNHLTFKTKQPSGFVVDTNKPLFIQAGSDAFSAIGYPPSMSANRESINIHNFVPYQTWKTDFEKYFPKKAELQDIKLDFSRYPEPVIDSMRDQKE